MDISDNLLLDAKEYAHRNSRTLRDLIEEGLRHTIRPQKHNAKFRLKDGSVSGQGLQPKMTWRQIRDASYEGRGA